MEKNKVMISGVGERSVTKWNVRYAEKGVSNNLIKCRACEIGCTTDTVSKVDCRVIPVVDISNYTMPEKE